MSAGIDSSRAAVVSAGAVGGFFGAMLARGGAPGYAARPMRRRLPPSRATGCASDGQPRRDAAPADGDHRPDRPRRRRTRARLRQVHRHRARRARDRYRITTDAVVLSLQNGVENADTLALLPGRTVLPAVVYVATAMPEAGLVRHFRRGDLVIGPRHDRSADAQLVALLDAVVAPLRGGAGASAHRRRRARRTVVKLMVSCATQRDLGRRAGAAVLPPARGAARDRRGAARRRARGRRAGPNRRHRAFELDASIEAMHRIAVAMPAQLSSTAQGPGPPQAERDRPPQRIRRPARARTRRSDAVERSCCAPRQARRGQPTSGAAG